MIVAELLQGEVCSSFAALKCMSSFLSIKNCTHSVSFCQLPGKCPEHQGKDPVRVCVDSASQCLQIALDIIKDERAAFGVDAMANGTALAIPNIEGCACMTHVQSEPECGFQCIIFDLFCRPRGDRKSKGCTWKGAAGCSDCWADKQRICSTVAGRCSRGIGAF